MNFVFSGKRALVTGAGAGIGRATAIKLDKIGAQVIALSKIQTELNSLKAEKPSIETVCVDLSDWSATREAVKKLTPIHLLVNNAGILHQSSFLESTPEEFDETFNVGVKAIMNVSQVVAADLIEQNLKGTIVNTSADLAFMAMNELGVFGASKAAVNHFTKTMALELSPKGIRVNSVNPSLVLTDMTKKDWSDKAKQEMVIACIPQGKLVEVENVVNAIIFLLSDNSDMVNGHSLPVEGGRLCC